MERGSTNVPEQEKAECWVAQYRVKSKSSTTWGKWATHQDYRTRDAAVRSCDSMRQVAEKFGLTRKADEEWRVLHVTQEVVY